MIKITMERIEEDYCSFEIAKLLKEKGFHEVCKCQYGRHGDISWTSCNNGNVTTFARPTLQMVMKWLRKKGIYVCPKLCCFCGSKKKDIPYYLWEPRILKLPSNNIIYPQPLDMCKHYENYEEATEEAIKYSLEHLI